MTTNASLDENGVPTIIAALNTDGSTIVRVGVNASNHTLEVSDGTTGTDHGQGDDLLDENGKRCFMGVSSADGVTPVVIYSDSSGKLLIKST